MLYDRIVERRQALVLKTAVKSAAIVSSLFPENVRDRLMDEATRQQSPLANPDMFATEGQGPPRSSAPIGKPERERESMCLEDALTLSRLFHILQRTSSRR